MPTFDAVETDLLFTTRSEVYDKYAERYVPYIPRYTANVRIPINVCIYIYIKI